MIESQNSLLLSDCSKSLESYFSFIDKRDETWKLGRLIQDSAKDTRKGGMRRPTNGENPEGKGRQEIDKFVNL